MKSNLRKELFDKAKQWILEAGVIIRKKINDPMIIDIKSNANDLVTTMDKEIELFFANHIKQSYPEHLLLGEEGYGDDVTSLKGTVWIIDPIDGTMNFVHQKRNFAISIGIYEEGIGEIGLIYDVMSGVLYSAIRGEGAYKDDVRLLPLSDDIFLKESIIGLSHRWLCKNSLVDERHMQGLVNDIRGTRTMGSAALEFAYVAEGILDGYLSMNLSSWDLAAGIIIVNEVGGITTDRDGKKIDMLTRSPVITCNKQLHDTIVTNYLLKGKK